MIINKCVCVFSHSYFQVYITSRYKIPTHCWQIQTRISKFYYIPKIFEIFTSQRIKKAQQIHSEKPYIMKFLLDQIRKVAVIKSCTPNEWNRTGSNSVWELLIAVSVCALQVYVCVRVCISVH